MSWTITLSPFAALPGATAGLSVAVEGATIFINGHVLDLSFMEEGDRIDREAISGEGAELILGGARLGRLDAGGSGEVESIAVGGAHRGVRRHHQAYRVSVRRGRGL